MTDTNIIERIKALDEERATLAEEAKAAALQQATEAINILATLGYHYHLSQEQYAKTATTRREAKGGPCPICNVTTDPPHDRRHHRSNPNPFTPEDLEERGMTVVS